MPTVKLKKAPVFIYSMPKRNKFCTIDSLRNESDVEQFFLIHLLHELGFSDEYIETKTNIREFSVGKGLTKKNYKPDYICFLDKAHKKPVIVIDAKRPTEGADEGTLDAQLYTSIIRRKLSSPKPNQYCVGTNGLMFIVKEYESDKEKIKLGFEDFIEGNQRFEQLKNILTYTKLKEEFEVLKGEPNDKNAFEFVRPETSELEGIFRACHNLIWKKEKIKPTEAFYEFSKLFFLKLLYDREIHELIKKRTPAVKDFTFSVHWIEEQEKWEKNPVDTILFKRLRNILEKEIKERNRKRIFEKDEKINLKPSTIKEVVRLLEHYDLFGVDEDLNGRMFESFLNATVRGEDLGQFFTPRSVVKFMVKLANLRVDKEKTDTVLDGLCGSGGFLIEAMANMFEKIKNKNSLSNMEKDSLRLKIVTESIWGTDANKNMSRISRMNMYLHGDGSNKIFWLPDFLDKNIELEEGIDDELKEEAGEFKKWAEDGLKFDVVLTNPPFSMRYQIDKSDEKRIIDQYEIARKNDGSLRGSLKSNVLSLERYYDLLKPRGKLITIIDESVLNTDSEKEFRDFIRRRFIIKAVISLPRNTFENAETNVKTSILYLIKKQNETEEQPAIFMAKSENVGHTDAGKPSSQLNDLPKIYEKFK